MAMVVWNSPLPLYADGLAHPVTRMQLATRISRSATRNTKD